MVEKIPKINKRASPFIRKVRVGGVKIKQTVTSFENRVSQDPDDRDPNNV